MAGSEYTQNGTRDTPAVGQERAHGSVEVTSPNLSQPEELRQGNRNDVRRPAARVTPLPRPGRGFRRCTGKKSSHPEWTARPNSRPRPTSHRATRPGARSSPETPPT